MRSRSSSSRSVAIGTRLRVEIDERKLVVRSLRDTGTGSKRALGDPGSPVEVALLHQLISFNGPVYAVVDLQELANGLRII